ncbi:MAG: hypothetical protein ABIL39_09000 [candidate division WOR-3 bacterium]
MNLILFGLFTASIFSIEGLGQERAILVRPFLGKMNRARIEFSLKPEWNIINKDQDIRSIFWTNPFFFNMKIPVVKDMIISLGSEERFNQSFDIYAHNEDLDMYVQGRGGIEELYLQLNGTFKFAEIFCRASYLYGSSREIWRYTSAGYSIADTFLYRNKGETFRAGVKVSIFGIYYEGLGQVLISKSIDTTYQLPQVLGMGVEYGLKDWEFALLFEHTFTTMYNPTNRFRLNVNRMPFGLYYTFNPWYIKGITEHQIGFSMPIGLKDFGVVYLIPELGVRSKGPLREFTFTPELKLVLEEVFGRRKK